MTHKLSSIATRQTIRRIRPGSYAATIRTTAGADTDLLYVTVNTESATALRGPCPGWQPRGEVLPSSGDSAAVLVLDDNSLWIVAWWPA